MSMDVKIHVDLENEMLKFLTVSSSSRLGQPPLELGECRMSDFNNEINSSRNSIHTEMIPNALRFIGETNDGPVLVIEQKPQYRMINWTDAFLDSLTSNVNVKSKNSYLIPVPWTQYLVQLNGKNSIVSIMGFCSSEPMGPNSCHYAIPIHNWYDNLHLCRPLYDEADQIGNQYSSMISIADQLEAEIWQSGFNMDLYTTISQFYDRCKSYNNTIFSKMGGVDAFTIAKGSWSRFSKLYYKAWSKLSMDEVLDFQWGHEDQAQRLEVGSMLPYPREKVLMTNSSILAHAQNAILTYQLSKTP